MSYSSSSDGGEADDSLVDVENHIREIESYLHSDAIVDGGVNPLLALAEHAQDRRQKASTTATAAAAASRQPAARSTASTPASLSAASTTNSSSYTQIHASTHGTPRDLAHPSHFSTPSAISSLGGHTARTHQHHNYDHHDDADDASSAEAIEYDPSRHAITHPPPATHAASEKDRIVAQLLQQHRQAKTAASASSRAPSSAAAAPRVPQPAAPQPIRPVLSASARAAAAAPAAVVLAAPPVVPAAIDRLQRDALVERLLQERRQQKAASDTHTRSPRGHAQSQQQRQQQEQDRATAAAYAAYVAAEAATAEPAPSHHLAVSAPSYSLHAHSSSLDDSTSSVGESSIHSVASPAHTHHSHHSGSSVATGSTHSPLDPRLFGAHQTIFDASEWINEDGTSIVHSNPTTQRSDAVEQEEDDDQEEEDGDQPDQTSYALQASTPSRSNVSSPRYPASPPFHPSRAQRINARTTAATAASLAAAGGVSTSAQSACASSSSTTTTTTTTTRPVAIMRPVSAAQQRAESASRTTSRAAQPVRSASAKKKSSTSPRQPPVTTLRPSTAVPTTRATETRRAHSLKKLKGGAPGTRTAAAGMGTGGGPHAVPTGSRYSKASIAAELEAERAAEFTFHPRLVSKPLVDSDATMEERLEVWTRRAEANRMRKLEARRAYEEDQLAECTFAPRTNVDKGQFASDPSEREEATLRLYHAADHRAAMREKARRLNESEQLAELPFTPALSVSSRRAVARKVQKGEATGKPIYQRVAELQRAKNEKLHAALLTARATDAATFKPEINPVSLALVRDRESKVNGSGGGGGATGGGGDDDHGARRDVERKLETVHRIEAERSRACTFVPEMNPVSLELLKKSRVFQGPNRDFLTRQERLSEASREEKEEKERQVKRAAGEDRMFRPNIGNADAILQQARQRQVDLARERGVPVPEPMAPVEEETKEQQVSRLSQKESHSLSLLKTKLRLAHEAQQGLTFKPEISNVSRQLAEQRAQALSQAGVDESAARQLAAELLAHRVASEFHQQHTFKPRLNSTSLEMVQAGLVESHYDHRDTKRMTAQIAADAAEKELRLQSLARAQSVAELQGCTFAPALKRGVPKARAEPVLVKGMNRFLQLKALKARQEAELRARERKVFLLDAAEAPPKVQPFTVAQPFHLSHEQLAGKRDAHREKVEREAEDRRMQECSFAPVTRQAQNRAMIQTILSEQDGLDEMYGFE